MCTEIVLPAKLLITSQNCWRLKPVADTSSLIARRMRASAFSAWRRCAKDDVGFVLRQARYVVSSAMRIAAVLRHNNTYCTQYSQEEIFAHAPNDASGKNRGFPR